MFSGYTDRMKQVKLKETVIKIYELSKNHTDLIHLSSDRRNCQEIKDDRSMYSDSIKRNMIGPCWTIEGSLSS